MHVVDDVPVESGLMITDVECQGGQSLGSIPDNGDADEEGDEEEALEEGRSVGRRVGDHRGLAQLEADVNESGLTYHYHSQVTFNQSWSKANFFCTVGM